MKKKISNNLWAIFGIISILCVCILIAHCLFNNIDNWFLQIENGNTLKNTMFESGDVLLYVGSILTFFGTVSLGALSLWQNQRFKQENDKAQKELSKIYESTLNIRILEEKRRIYYLFSEYVNAVREMFFILEFVQELTPENIKEKEYGLLIAMLSKEKAKEKELKRIIPYKHYADSEYLDYVQKLHHKIQEIAPKDRNMSDIAKDLVTYWQAEYSDFTEKSYIFLEDLSENLDVMLREELIKNEILNRTTSKN